MSCGSVPLTPLNTNTHALTCNSQKRLGSTVRHDLALLVIDDFLTSIGVPHTNEPQLFRHYDSNTKPDRIYHLPAQPVVADMTIHSPTVHSQAGKLNNSTATLKAADSQKKSKYDSLSTRMGYKFIPLSATPYGAVGTPFENFLVLLANASEDLGGQNYEQALTLLQNNLTMTIQKANVEILLQALANSSSHHRPNQARVDQEPSHYTPTVTHDNPIQSQQHPLLLSMLNFKLPHSHNIQDTNFNIPNGIILFARNLHLNRSIFIPQPETHTQVVQKFPLPNLPYDPVNLRALDFLHYLARPPHLLSPPSLFPPSSPSSPIHLAPSLPASHVYPVSPGRVAPSPSTPPADLSNPFYPAPPSYMSPKSSASLPNAGSPPSPAISASSRHVSHTSLPPPPVLS
jgi:hypothetical protein